MNFFLTGRRGSLRLPKQHDSPFRAWLLIPGLFLLLPSGSCSTGPSARTGKQALYGMIYDGDNRPVNGATISVDGAYRAASDINGHFIISGLRAKTRFTVTAEKPGFETAETEVFFTDPSHILYFRLLPGEYLLREAENAAAGRRWHDAALFLERARNSGADSVLVQYLEAAVLLLREKYEEALAVLTGAAETRRDAPYLYLLMADICQYHLAAPGQARIWLEKFQALRGDREVARRFEELTAEQH